MSLITYTLSNWVDSSIYLDLADNIPHNTPPFWNIIFLSFHDIALLHPWHFIFNSPLPRMYVPQLLKSGLNSEPSPRLLSCLQYGGRCYQATELILPLTTVWHLTGPLFFISQKPLQLSMTIWLALTNRIWIEMECAIFWPKLHSFILFPLTMGERTKDRQKRLWRAFDETAHNPKEREITRWEENDPLIIVKQRHPMTRNLDCYTREK